MSNYREEVIINGFNIKVSDGSSIHIKDNKRENFGILNGEVVSIDYGE